MEISVTTQRTANGARATARVSTPRDTDREAMRRVLADSGFEHALGSIGHAVAVELVGSVRRRNLDEKLQQTSDEVERVVLDALVYAARSAGWSGGR